MEKRRILLVEDDLINQFAVEKFINKYYEVICTDNSESAMEILNSHNIDLVLMDISIKGSLNGLQLTEKIKLTKDKKIPVIALTAHAFPQDKINCMKAGCDEYLSKPYSKDELLNKMALFLTE